MTRWFEVVPEWIAAMGTGGAFLTAAFAFRRSTQDRHSAQARQIQAYLPRSIAAFDYSESGPKGLSLDRYAGHFDDGLLTYDGFDESFSIEDDAAVAYITLSNNSGEFAHALSVTLINADGDEAANISVPTIAPATDLPLIAVMKPLPGNFSLKVVLRFTDAGGSRWISKEGSPVREARRPWLVRE